MTDSSTSFGFLIQETALEFSIGHLKPLANHADIVQRIRSHDRSYDSWFYPPLLPVSSVSNEAKVPPEIPTLSFRLPATHELTLNDPTADDKTAEFYIAVFGLLKGLRLQRDGWNHFYKCPTKSGELCDFIATDGEIIQTLNLAAAFWQKHQNLKIRTLMFGAIHWHLFAQLYPHAFEKFNAQYMALDACWKLARETSIVSGRSTNHALRPSGLAVALSLQTPSWANAISPSKKECDLSRKRNELAHEALYGGVPIGFAASSEDYRLQLELKNFVARCIFGLLGVKNVYTQSPVDSRQIRGFNF
jgi:hypothetical protein